MIRKLIQLSPSTAVVSMPSQWVKRNKLERGAQLSVEEKENSIIVSARSKKSSKEISLDIKGIQDTLIWYYVDAAYVAGYDTIVLLTSGHAQAGYLSTVVKCYPGMIISEERNNCVRFEDLAADKREDIDKILCRIFNMNIAMLDDAIDACKKKDLEALAKMKRRDYDINSYIAYCLRQLGKFGFTPISKTGIMHSYIKILEMVSDKLCAICMAMGKGELKSDPKLLCELKDIYNVMYRTHFKQKKDALILLEKKRAMILRYSAKDTLGEVYTKDILDLLSNLEELEMEFRM